MNDHPSTPDESRLPRDGEAGSKPTAAGSKPAAGPGSKPAVAEGSKPVAASGGKPGRRGRQVAAGMRGLYQKRGWFYYQAPTPETGARPAAVALKTQDLGTALVALSELKQETEMERAVMKGTLNEILPAYYEAKRRDAKATRMAREVILGSFCRHAGNPKISGISAGMVTAWLDDLASGKGARRGKAASKATLKSYLITLRALLNWAVRERILRESPLQPERWRRETRVSVTKVQGFFTVEERERLLAQEMADPTRLVLHLGFFAGLREGEMLAANGAWLWLDAGGERGSLTVQDTPVRFTDGTAGTWQPKGRRRRTVPLHPSLLAYLQANPPGPGWWIAPEKDVWPGEDRNSKRFDTKKALAGVAKRAGVKHLTCHMLRHSFATHLAMKGVALAEIAAILGDSIKVTEDHYAGFSPSRVNPLDGI